MPIPITIPKATITMEEANVAGWRKQPGDAVSAGEVLFEIETDKVIVEVPASAAGVLLRIDVPEGTAKLGQTIGWIGEPGESIPDTTEGGVDHTAAVQAVSQVTVSDKAPGVIAASPAARRLARELSIDLATVTGTGPGGRILETDVRNARRDA